MGVIHSMLQSTVFCVERSLTCMFAACFVIVMLFVILCIMVYGTSIGYHYNQKELAALSVRLHQMKKGPKPWRRHDDEEYRSQEAQPYVPSVLRVLPVNRSLDSMEELINRAVTMKELAPATAPTPGVVYEGQEGPPIRPEESLLGKSVRRRIQRTIKNTTKFNFH